MQNYKIPRKEILKLYESCLNEVSAHSVGQWLKSVTEKQFVVIPREEILHLCHAFDDIEEQEVLGELKVKISGCINACGHHHVGHIGILGVDKKGEEYYQITFGGRADEKASIGEIAGKGLKQEEVPDALRRVVERYRQERLNPQERFIDMVERVGTDTFKEALYAVD